MKELRDLKDLTIHDVQPTSDKFELTRERSRDAQGAGGGGEGGASLEELRHPTRQGSLTI